MFTCTSSRQNTGFTIVELLMVLAVSSLVLGALSQLTGSAFTSSRQQLIQVRVTEDARLHVQRIVDAIRQAPVIDCNFDGYTDKSTEYWLHSATATSITILQNVDDDDSVEQVKYYRDSTNPNQLRRAVYQPENTCQWRSTAESDTVLLSSLDPNASTLFTFYDGPSDTDDHMPTISAANIMSVKRIGISLALEKVEGKAAAAATIYSSAVARAVRCVPQYCEPLVDITSPTATITLTAREVGQTNGSSQITVNHNASIVLEWLTSGCVRNIVASASDSPATWTGNQSEAGSATVANLQGPKIVDYRLSCNDASGNPHFADARVTVNAPGPISTISLTARKSALGSPAQTSLSVSPGESIVLEWRAVGCTGSLEAVASPHESNWSGTITAHAGSTPPIGPLAGSATTNERTITYTLTCSQGANRPLGPFSAQAVVRVVNADMYLRVFPADYLTDSPTWLTDQADPRGIFVTNTEQFYLRWQSSGCSADPIADANPTQADWIGSQTPTAFSPMLGPLTGALPGTRIDYRLTCGAVSRIVTVEVIAPTFTCGQDWIDSRDGQVYPTAQFGPWCWMTKNMNVGALISGGSPQPASCVLPITKYCYNNLESNCDIYGGMYRWDHAVCGQIPGSAGVQGICPVGWHIPSHDQFTQLERAVCTSASCATDFPFDLTTTGSRGTNEGTTLKDTNGFASLLAGYKTPSTFGNGTFIGVGGLTYMWTSTPAGNEVWVRSLGTGGSVWRSKLGKTYGFSVRCVKN